MQTKDRILRSIRNRKTEKAFLRREFDRFGSPATVTRALQVLLQEGSLVRVGKGVYATATISRLSGRVVPASLPEEYVPVALRKLGVTVRPGRDVSAYNQGETTQLPMGLVYNTGRRQINRKFLAKDVRFENDLR
jgi:hypothetical protein